MKSDREIEKAMAADLKKEYGAFVSVADLHKYTNRSWAYIAGMLTECKTFGEDKHKKYFYQDAAEAICRNS